MTRRTGLDAAALAGAAPLTPKGRLAENVVHFVRVLRAAGMPVGPARTLAALEAVMAVGLARREDFRAALAAVLVSRHEQLPVFEQAFDFFWRNPRLLEKLIASLLPRVYGRGGEAEAEPELPARIAQAMLPPAEPGLPRVDEDEIELDAAFSVSPREILQRKDFETMTAAELATVRGVLRNLRLPLPELPTRRTTPASRGHRVDLRATMRRATGAAGDARAAVLAAACATDAAAGRALRHLRFDGPLREDAAAFPACDHQRPRPRPRAAFRDAAHQHHPPAQASRCRRGAGAGDDGRVGLGRRHADRRLPGGIQPALVAAAAGAERGRPADQRRARRRRRARASAAQTERLHKSCRRLVWLNPLLRYEGFEARPAGIRAMLPHVDDFLPVHNLESLTQLAAALDRPQSRGAVPAPGRRVPAEERRPMEMTSTRTIPAPVAIVWAALNDPETLKGCIAGCDAIEPDGESAYRIALAAKVGPVSAKFTGRMQLADVDPPHGYTLSFDGQGGAAGFAKGEAKVSLAAAENGAATTLSYVVKAQVGGKMAQIGSRLVDGAAQKLADDFFGRFSDAVAAAAGVAPVVPAPVPRRSWVRYVAIALILGIVAYLFSRVAR